MIKVGQYFHSLRKWRMVVWVGNMHLIYIEEQKPNFYVDFSYGFKSSIRTFVYIPELEERVRDPLFEIELKQFITKHDLK